MTYLWAGYLLTWIAVAWYAWRLEGRIGRAERRLEQLTPEDAPRDPAAPGGAPRS